MDKSGFFTALGAHLKANRLFYLLVLFIVLSVGGYFWWQAGFSLDINKFFAGSCENLANHYCAPYCQSGHSQDSSNSCTNGALTCCQVPTPSPSPTAVVTTTINPPPGSDICSGIPAGARKWTQNGVTVCVISETFTPQPDRCTINNTGATLTYTVGIVNGSAQSIYSKPALFSSPAATCAAIDTGASGNASQYLTTGPRNIAAGYSGTVTYSFTPPGNCGTWQLDDTWGPGQLVFVIGKVINTGRVCATPTPSTCPATAPATLATSNITGNSATLNWTPGAGGTQQILRVGPNQADVQSGCPNGTCIVAVGNLPATQSSYQVTGLSPNTTYYWRVVTFNSAACYKDAVTSFTSSPTPTPTNLSCASLSGRTINVGQSVQFQATGGTGVYAWFAPGSNTTTGSANPFSTSYSTPGFKTVTVASGGNQAACTVTISVQPTVTPTPTPTLTLTPTPTPTLTSTPLAPIIGIQKLVRNITQNSGEADSVTANPNDTVEFSATVTAAGTSAALDVLARDTLPAGLSYQAGTTTIDGISAADGLVGSGLNLGTMVPGRSITIRFRATVADQSFFLVGTTTLVNIAYAQGSNVAQVSDTAFVNVTRGSQVLSMTLTKMGRNLTRGQSGEYSSVNASPDENIEFVLHIRNVSSSTLTNVMIRDIVPQGITYQGGTARLNGQLLSDALVGSGVNIGSLAVGQEAVITLIGHVASAGNLPAGTTTLINTAQASADSVPTLTAQLPIIITNSNIVIPPVSTGPGESTILALIVSAIVTLLYVGYTGTDMFRRREAGQLAKEARKDHGLFDFKR